MITRVAQIPPKQLASHSQKFIIITFHATSQSLHINPKHTTLQLLNNIPNAYKIGRLF